MTSTDDPITWLYSQYREGRFPMADTADGVAVLMEPEVRALIPISTLHIPDKLLKTVRQFPFEIKIDTAFDAVIAGCAEATPTRPETWINPDIRAAFHEFHMQGRAHSIECWLNGQLVGGLYGLEVGGAFCGESMFSRVTDASKVALVHLCARLYHAKFSLLDAQYQNPHLVQFGLYRMSQKNYVAALKKVRDEARDFKLREFKASEQDLVVSYLKNR